jgi:FtsZ-interacting cell division protein ZipA
MERVWGLLALAALVAVPFWLSRRKEMKRNEDWNHNHEPDSNVTNVDTNTTTVGDGGHH